MGACPRWPDQRRGHQSGVQHPVRKPLLVDGQHTPDYIRTYIYIIYIGLVKSLGDEIIGNFREFTPPSFFIDDSIRYTPTRIHFSFVRSFDFHFILNGFLCSFCCFFFSFHTQFVDTFLYRHRFHAHVLNLSILRHCHTQTFDRCWVYVPLFLYLSLSLSLLSSLFLSVSMSIKRAARSRVRSRLLRSRTSSFLEINFLIIYIEGGDEVNCKPVEELLSTFCSYYHRCFLRRAWKGLMHPFLFPFSFFFVSHARWESQIEQPDCVLNCRLSLWSSPDIRGS